MIICMVNTKKENNVKIQICDYVRKVGTAYQ